MLQFTKIIAAWLKSKGVAAESSDYTHSVDEIWLGGDMGKGDFPSMEIWDDPLEILYFNPRHNSSYAPQHVAVEKAIMLDPYAIEFLDDLTKLLVRDGLVHAKL